MAVTGEGLEKFEDMIVRAAETTATHARAAGTGRTCRSTTYRNGMGKISALT